MLFSYLMVLQAIEKQGNLAAASPLQTISPLAWQHINFYGRYQFDSDMLPMDIGKLAETLMLDSRFSEQIIG